MGGSFRDPEDHPSERRAQEPPVGVTLGGRGGGTLMKMLALALLVVTLVVPSTHAADLDRTAVDFKTPAEITWVRNDRFFVVVSGTWWMGTGERFDPAGAVATPQALAELVSAIDDLGFDSLWLSEVLTGPVIDPLVGLAWAAAANPRVKLGTTALLPGRNVVRLAKQLASLDVLCNGRLLVTLVPGLTYSPEREAIGIEPKRRGAFIDEALPLLRRLWAGEMVSHEGALGSFKDVRLSPLPVQQPLEVWLGGTAPAALERCGRLSDGWLPSLCT